MHSLVRFDQGFQHSAQYLKDDLEFLLEEHYLFIYKQSRSCRYTYTVFLLKVDLIQRGYSLVFQACTSFLHF